MPPHSTDLSVALSGNTPAVTTAVVSICNLSGILLIETEVTGTVFTITSKVADAPEPETVIVAVPSPVAVSVLSSFTCTTFSLLDTTVD